MKNKFLSSLLASFAIISLCEAKGDSLLLSGAPREQHITVNNKILAKVNGKAISVIDLMKKMDMLFYRQYPQYTSSVEARFQFYQMHWKQALGEIIDKELIIADSQESKLTVNPGDIRQEMETLFGPNIISNLDKIGLTFNEAYKMVQDDISLRRMLYFRVQAKVINQVTPQKVRNYYEEIAKNNIRDNEWVFSVVTVRHRDSTKAAERANLVHRLLAEDKIPLAELTPKLKEMNLVSEKQPTVTLSEEFHTKEKELSEVFKKILVTLTPDTYSAPIIQKSRNESGSVIRIFHLKEMVQGGVVPFSELEGKIKEKMVEEGAGKETEAYLKRLRQHFDVEDAHMKEILSSDFQPFVLN